MKSFLLCFYLFTYDLNKKQEKKNLLTVMCNKDINVKKFNGQKKILYTNNRFCIFKRQTCTYGQEHDNASIFYFCF